MKLPKLRRKYVAGALAAGLIMGAGGIAAAYFPSSGSGAGSAKAGSVSALTITQVGAGYDSLISSNSPDPYSASLCFVACQGNKEIGDQVTLANTTGYEHLTSVTVPLVNFGAGKNLTVTLNLLHGPNGTYSFTKQFLIAPGSSTTQVVTNVTFTLAKTAVYVYKTFEYGIALTANTSGVNIALVNAKHTNDVTVGSTAATTVWLKTGTTTFKATTTWTTGYVPAVEINDIGGVVPALFPGAPAQPVHYAITNPNAGTVRVTAITAAIKTSGITVTGASGCLASWFTLAGNPWTYGGNVPPGMTVVTTNPTTLALKTVSTNQVACEGITVPLTFTSN